MENPPIKCDRCNKILFTPKDGEIPSQAIGLGFVYKNAILYTNTNTPLYFCSQICTKLYYRKFIPKNPEVDKAMKEIREGIPAASKEIAGKMVKLIKILKPKK